MLVESRLVAQFVIGIVFLWSSLGKLKDPVKFVKGVARYDLLPPGLSYVLGAVLIPLESFIALSHLTGWKLEIAAPASIVLMSSFFVAVLVTLRRGLAVSCLCFGSSDGELISGRTIARLSLLIMTELLLLMDYKLWSGDLFVYPERLVTAFGFGLAALWTALTLNAGLWLLTIPDLFKLKGKKCRSCARQPA